MASGDESRCPFPGFTRRSENGKFFPRTGNFFPPRANAIPLGNAMIRRRERRIGDGGSWRGIDEARRLFVR
jgi:hypothetical protein